MQLSDAAARLVACLPSLLKRLPGPDQSLSNHVCIHFCEVNVAIETDSDELAALLQIEYGFAGEERGRPLSTIQIYTKIQPYILLRHKSRVLALDPSADHLLHVGDIDVKRLEIIAGSVSKRVGVAHAGSSAVASCIPVVELLILEVLQGYMPSILFIHASSVAKSRNAIVLVGPSGSGKTTTAGAFQQLEYCVIADDITAIDLRSMVVLGFPQKRRQKPPPALNALVHLVGKSVDTTLFEFSPEQAVQEAIRSCLSSPASVIEHYIGLWKLCHRAPSYGARLGSVNSVAHQIELCLAVAR